jgi:hypothetical protein
LAVVTVLDVSVLRRIIHGRLCSIRFLPRFPN